MKIKNTALSSVLLAGVTASTSHAAITISDAEPTGVSVILDAISGGTAGTTINSTGNPGSRGTAFTIGTATDSVDISGFTIQANNADTFTAGQNFTVVFYTGTAGTFPAPGSNAAATADFLETNSGLTIVGSETFAGTDAMGDAPAGTVGAGDYLTFDFTNDITVAGGAEITAFIFTDFAFSQTEGTGNGGGRFQYRGDTTALADSASRDLRFSVLGTVTAIPEPSSLAFLVLGGLAFARRRRS